MKNAQAKQNKQDVQGMQTAQKQAAVPNGANGNKDITELVFILDRSGSMAGLESDTIGGFNAMLKKHQEAEGQGALTTILFDDKLETLHDRVDLAEVAPLTKEDYWVRGCTALLDAVGSTINHISRVQGYLPEEHRAGNVIFVITTDGFENASREYDYAKVKALINQKKELGWEFFFLGANIDAEEEASRLGIDQDRAATYVADAVGTTVMYEAVAGATMKARARCCASAPMDGSWKANIAKDTARRRLFRSR